MTHYHSSTMEVVTCCSKCGRQLKETEEYFYHHLCTECVYQQLKQSLVKNNE